MRIKENENIFLVDGKHCGNMKVTEIPIVVDFGMVLKGLEKRQSN